MYREPLTLRDDTTVTARLFLPDGRTSEAVRASYRFGLEELELESPTVLDARPVFCGGGAADLLLPLRGSLDYLDGRWRGTLQDWDLRAKLPGAPEGGLRFPGLFVPSPVRDCVSPVGGALHRPGPGPSAAAQPHHLPCVPAAREIAKEDVTFQVFETLGAFRILAHRYETMPQWCCYRGAEHVFLMADRLIVRPD